MDVLRRHPDVPRIAGFVWFRQSLLVVECDMPWKEGLEAKYGDSFRPWAEEDFQDAIGNITAAFRTII